MAAPGKVDYHVHYHIDPCALPEMTLPVIDRAAREMGLEEITVVKHYSAAFPNGEKDWVAWHVTATEVFERYIRELAQYQPAPGLTIHTGVETELVDERGNINMDAAAMEKIEGIALSVHYMPAFDKITKPFLYYPGLQKQLLQTDPVAAAEFARWHELVRDLGAEYFVERLFAGYEAAIRRYPKICQLSHMYDGFYPMRVYQVPFETIPESRILDIMEPMMQAMAENGVLWELCPDPAGSERILRRAAEMGVKFVATSDAHSLRGDWGRFVDHPLAEAYIDGLGLPKGVWKFR